MEGVNEITTGKLVSLPEQEVVDCVNKSKGCHGGWYLHAFQWIIDNGAFVQKLIILTLLKMASEMPASKVCPSRNTFLDKVFTFPSFIS